MTSESPRPDEPLGRRTILDEENPWPGLVAFDEASERFFHGRAEVAAELRRLVLNSSLTVLFGASGLGKTSLLQAGLFPLLRKSDVLPIYLRLDVHDRAAPLVDQLKHAVLAQCRKHEVVAPAIRDGESLWEWLHREDFELWSRRNRRLTPLFVLDQFEEVFTLGAENADAVARFRIDLADLIEHRIPVAVADRIAAGGRDGGGGDRDGDGDGDRDGDGGLSLSSQRYKVLVSFREDFLPDVEGWARDVPSLMRHRVRLLPMSGAQAFDAVHRTAPHLADEGIAWEIVRFVAAAQTDAATGAAGAAGAAGAVGAAGAGVGTADPELQVEPALLSLVCDGLNQRRKAQGKRAFDIALLRATGPSIVTDYYEASVAGLPPRVQRFITEELITERGFRKPCDIDDARALHGVTEAEIRTLVDRRLLRIEPHRQTHRVELTHDLLTRVVRESRDQQRERAKAQRQRKRIALASGVVAVLLILAIVLIVYNARAARAIEREARAVQTADQAVQERKAMYERLVLLQGEKDAQVAAVQAELQKLRNSRPGSDDATRALQAIGSAERALSTLSGTDAQSVAALAVQLNDASESVRKGAGGRLARDHLANPLAIGLVLGLLSEESLPKLSASGRINALYFLSRSESSAWSAEHKMLARQAIQRIRTRAAGGSAAIGSQTAEELARLEKKIAEP
jgi:hypothetical protein